MTIDELIQSDQVFVKPADIAPILRCDAQQLRVEARRVPCKLGFPVVIYGQQIRIPRKPFLQYIGVI